MKRKTDSRPYYPINDGRKRITHKGVKHRVTPGAIASIERVKPRRTAR